MPGENSKQEKKCLKEGCPVMAAIGPDVFEKFYPLMNFPVKECMHQFQGNCHFEQTKIKESDVKVKRDSLPNVYFLKGEEQCDRCSTRGSMVYWKLVDRKTHQQMVVCQKCELDASYADHEVVERHVEFSSAYLHRKLEFTLWKAGSHDQGETVFSDISIWDGHVIEAIKHFTHLESMVAGFSEQVALLSAYNDKIKDDPSIKKALDDYARIASMSKDFLASLKKLTRFERFLVSVVKV